MLMAVRLCPDLDLPTMDSKEGLVRCRNTATSRQLPPPGSPRGPSRRSTRVASVHSSAEKGLSVSLGLGDPHHPSEQGLWAARFSKLMGKPEANRDTVPSGVRRSPQLSLSRSRGGGCLAQEPSPTGLLGTGASVPGAPSLRPSRQGGR